MTHFRRNTAILSAIVSILAAHLTIGGVAGAQGAKPEPGGSSQISKPLKPGKRLSAKLRGGQTHSHAIQAEAGQFVHVVVDQKHMDLAVTLLDPSGKQAAQMHMTGRESLSAIAESSGEFRLQIAASSNDARPGRYGVRFMDLRAPADADRTRVAAERAYMDGQRLFDRKDFEAAALQWEESARLWHGLEDANGEGVSLQRLGLLYYFQLPDNGKALDYDMRAVPLERAAKNRASEALTLTNLGAVYGDLGEKQKALDYDNQALRAERSVGNRAGEALTLTNFGIVYWSVGQRLKALDYFNQALSVERAAADLADESRTLNDIGLVYSDFGEQQKALDSYEQALPIARALQDRRAEASALLNIGKVYEELGEQQKALDFYQQALPIEHAVGDRAGEARTLNNISSVYLETGELEKALDSYIQALPIAHAVGDRAGEARTLSNIGIVYSDLGDQHKPLDFYNQALPIERAVEDRAGEANTLNAIAGVYSETGEHRKALDFYNQALRIERAVGDRAGEARALSNIGIVFLDLAELQKALDSYNQALPIERAVGDRVSEAATLRNMGVVYANLGEPQMALDSYTQSLPIFRAVQDPLGEGRALALLMEYWKEAQSPNLNLAVLFGKQAIDRFQQVRRNIAELDKEAQQSFLKSKEDYYRELAGLLISQGRLPEAQQVLDLLKLEEYSDFTQHRGDAGSVTNPAALTLLEQKTNKEYDQITDNITAIGSEWAQLQGKSPRSADEEKRYNDLSDRMTAANQRFQTFLKNLYVVFGKDSDPNRPVENIDEATAGLKTLLGELGAGTTAVYTLVLDDKCVLMVITPETRVEREVPIGRSELRAKVFAFIRSVAGRYGEADIQAKAQDLYNILIAPIEKDLQGAQAKTLVWSLDDVLRYAPLAALYDGKQYLVERYQNVVITTASVGNLKDQPHVSSWHGLAMGVSKDYDGLGQLKAVPGELDAVIRSDKTFGSHGPVPGVILLDDSFTETSMESELELHPPLVHIASHYVFQPGDDQKSYLLLGGKETGGQGFHLTLADLGAEQRMDFKGIELLTLSGCQTAVGSNDSDGREIDGLGITAQKKGAKAVVATLWPVDDSRVGQLMATFYKLWITPPGMTKVEALRQAQLAAMRGNSDAAGASRGVIPMDSPASGSKQAVDSRYANPYYWAPFILIGNWK